MCLSQEVRAASARPGFFIMKRLKVFLPPLDEISVDRKVTPPPRKFFGTGINTEQLPWFERWNITRKSLPGQSIL